MQAHLRVLHSNGLALETGYVRVERIAGESPYYAYAVINDGGHPGERSGDGSYISSSPSSFYEPKLDIAITGLPADHQFCFGASWRLTVSNAPPDALVRLVPDLPPSYGFQLPPGAKTDAEGKFGISGTIPYIGRDIYTFTFRAEAGGILSNLLTITTFDCD
jgi:hypothetical protein